MLHVGVLQRREDAADFIVKHNIGADGVILAADEDGRFVGFSAISVKNGNTHISAAEYDDDDVCELMLRAAVSYGERRYAQTVTTDLSEPQRVLAALGFRLIDGQMTARTDNVVHICKKSE